MVEKGLNKILRLKNQFSPLISNVGRMFGGEANAAFDPGAYFVILNTVRPRNLLILGRSKIVPQIAKSADCECYCM